MSKRFLKPIKDVVYVLLFVIWHLQLNLLIILLLVNSRLWNSSLKISDVLIDHSEKLNIEGAILFLDFTKAFHSLEWSFMTECLEQIGFKSSFIRWIRAMHTDIKGCILNNGWASASFRVFEDTTGVSGFSFNFRLSSRNHGH